MEKDFILRLDRKYSLRAKSQVEVLKNTIANSDYLENKKNIVEKLDRYWALLSQYIKNRVGSRGSKQLFIELDTLRNKIMAITKKMHERIIKDERDFLQTHNNLMIMVLTLSMALTALIIGASSSHITRPLYKLTRHMKKYIETGTSQDLKIESGDEIEDIKNVYLDLIAEVDRQRQIIESKTKFATLGEVTANFSHEIKNSVNVIHMAHEYLNKNIGKMDSNPKIEKYVNNIEVGLNQITRITESVRNLSREDISDEFKVVPLSDVLATVRVLVFHYFDTAGVALEFDEFSKDVKINCQETLLGQVIINLLNNARHAAEANHKKWVKCSTLITEGKVHIEVIDSGKGIPNEIKEKLFLKHFTSKVKGEGTGLGLVFSRKVIEQHGGEIWLDDNRKNTTFVIELPLVS